jgi:nucleotide-binding universal stress UspA family protein
MSQQFRILAAVDLSTAGRAAFDQALALSDQTTELTVVHAVPTSQGFAWRARARIALIAQLRQAAEAAGVRLALSVQQGDPVEIILLHATSRQPDLIVLGTHQRTGLDRLRAGSVAERVAREATQPVLIVPVRRAAGEATASFAKVVAAVDFSAASARAVEWALRMGRSEDTRVTLLHVIRAESSAHAPRYLYRLGAFEFYRSLAADAWRQLQDMIPQGDRTQARAHARVVTGDAATQIARVAAEIDADLIVVGVRRRGAIARRIFDATVARVTRRAACAVLAVPEQALLDRVRSIETARPALAA